MPVSEKQPLVIYASVSEFGGDVGTMVKLDDSFLADITEGDNDPQFVTIRVEEGKSKNNITYGRDILTSVAEQINSEMPTGYLGHVHMKPEHKDALLPDPQTLWCGATVVTEGGKAVLYAKGYNLPDSKVRNWIKKKVVNSVSWAGDAILEPVREGGYRARELMIESFDWSRKNSQGMSTKVVAVTTEMEGGNEVTADEIKSLQLSELEAHNPDLVALIKKAAADETRTTVVQEMETARANEPAPDEVAQVAALRDRFEIPADADPVEFISQQYEALDSNVQSVGRERVKEWFDKLLAEKVPNEKARGIVGKLITVTEMQGDFIKDADKIKTDLEAKVDDVLENDEGVKELITLTEMGSTRGGLRMVHRPAENDGERKSSNLEEEEVLI